MKLEIPNCPQCGQPAKVEPGLLSRLERVKPPDSKIVLCLICAQEHEWQSGLAPSPQLPTREELLKALTRLEAAVSAQQQELTVQTLNEVAEAQDCARALIAKAKT